MIKSGWTTAQFLGLLIAWPGIVAAGLERSVSPSQQFIVYGVDSLARGQISDLAEKTKANLLHLLRQPDQWKTPIVFNLQRPQANLPEIPPIALRFSQTGFGLKLQIDLVIGPADQVSIERELLRAILLEMIYRNDPQIAVGTAYVEPPDWLIDGVMAMASDSDRTGLLQTLRLSKSTMSLPECLSPRPSRDDPSLRQLQRAYSFALLQFLVSQPNGAKRLSSYIDNLARATNDSVGDLQAQFPELAETNAAEKWRSNVARLSQDHQLLTFAETERELTECRQSLDRKTPLLSSGERSRPKLSRSEAMALSTFRDSLLLLGTRANPVLRPTVQEYQQIAASLAAGKSKGVTDRLRRAEALHAKICARMSEIDDYLNWCEATKLTKSSGVFANYLTAAEQASVRPRRRDAISVYLDTIEEEIGN